MTNNGRGDGCPSWSPDSKHIALHADTGDGKYGFTIVKPDGSELVEITKTERDGPIGDRARDAGAPGPAPSSGETTPPAVIVV